MSVEQFAEREADHLGFRLTRIYLRWTLGYIAGITLLWVLGIEAIYENVTPFYAYLSPAFFSAFVPAMAVFAMGVAIVAAWAIFVRPRAAFSRDMLKFLLTWAFVVAVLFLVWGSEKSLGIPKTSVSASWAELRWHLLALAVFLVFLSALIYALHRLDWFEVEPSPRAVAWMLLGLVAFTFAFAGAIAMLRNGVPGITRAYSRYQYEYIHDIGFGGSIQGLFHDYVARHQFLSMHAKVHPPGPVVLLWILSYIAGGQDPLSLSLATMVVGSLAIVPLYFWVKDLLGKRVALTACIVYSLVPSIVLFTATSADTMFMPFTLLTLFLFGRAVERRSIPYALAAGLGYGVMALLSFSLLAVGAWFGFYGLWRLTQKGKRLAVVQTAILMLIAFLAVLVLVKLWSGFNYIDCFRAAKAQFNTDQINLDKFGPRYPSWTWKFLNPLAWAFFAGVPVTLLFFWRLFRPEPKTRTLFLIAALTLIVLDFTYLARGEGERSAMYVFPFLIVPAACALDAMGSTTKSLRPLIATASFLAFQCWLIESFLDTYW